MEIKPFEQACPKTRGKFTMKLSKSKFQEHQDTSAPQMLKVPFKKEGPEADADLRALHLRQLGALFEGKNIKLLSPLPRPWKGAIKLKELILRLHKKSTLSLKQKQHFSSNTYWETHKRPIYINFKPELCTAEQHHRTAHPRSSAHEVFVWMCPWSTTRPEQCPWESCNTDALKWSLGNSPKPPAPQKLYSNPHAVLEKAETVC